MKLLPVLRITIPDFFSDGATVLFEAVFFFALFLFPDIVVWSDNRMLLWRGTVCKHLPIIKENKFRR